LVTASASNSHARLLEVEAPLQHGFSAAAAAAQISAFCEVAIRSDARSKLRGHQQLTS
jgi:hypothetical protein